MENNSLMNLIISGPCGVGKSTIGEIIAERMGMVFLNLDEHRDNKMGNYPRGLDPCSVSFLNLKECMYATIDRLSTSFILDIGGDTVFRRGVDNDDRRVQILTLKKRYSAQIILLTSERDVLLRRFTNCEKRKMDGNNKLEEAFNEMWTEWLSIGSIYWTSCADLILDTTYLSVIDAVKQVEKKLKQM
jgi:shikimate kinase